jgi:DNA-binding SARP family transcriptional activator/tetratricopeptide (TPR) repeat protein
MLRLLTFGGLALERHDGPAPRLRPQRLAILAVIATAGNHGISRERLAALFWPDSDNPRHSLRQGLYALRHELGVDTIAGDGVLAIDSRALTCDLVEFRAALAAGDRIKAATLATGPFLHGFTLASHPEFERWADEERATISTSATKLLLTLAKEAEAGNNFETAADWWKRLTILDPLSGRFALGNLKALANAGDRAGALAFARAHERLVRRELEADPDPEIRRLEAELRALPSPAVTRVAPRKAAAISTPPETDAELPETAIQSVMPAGHRALRRPVLVVTGMAALIMLAIALTTALRRSDSETTSKAPTFAVGMISEEGIPDTLRIGGVLTDMLATNLARIGGLSVVANSRLFELMLPGQDTLPGGYLDAARRAGATEILQGRLLPGPQWTLSMEIQRVDLKTGLVKQGYRIAAPDRYALVDSMTSVIAQDLKLGSPGGSIADAMTDNQIAYRLYEEGLRAYNQYDEAASLRLMNAALEEDSTFAMAAYYAARSLGNDISLVGNRARALRLARRAPERERLTITADLHAEDMDPRATAIAESLAAKYPTDPRGHEFLWKALWTQGEWARSVTAIEKAIALDSAAEPAGRQGCRLCSDYSHLAETYFWWDSLAAAERTANRGLRLRPSWHGGWDILIRSAAALGDTARTAAYLRKFRQTNPLPLSPFYLIERDILLENYDRAESALQPYLESPRADELGGALWLETIILRNQGRITEAMRLANSHPAPSDLNLATAALEAGLPSLALPKLRARAADDLSYMAPSLQARVRTWNNTLIGMAFVVAGDTAAVRRLADTVEYWGRHSLYGRDHRAHNYLRGMLLVARGKDAEAVPHLRAAIHSPTNGFTRVNLELGKALLRLNRPQEAVPVVRAALHGGIDGSNLYVTRTDLHEVLAQAFARTGSRDSAAFHYRAVANAWKRADAAYHGRREVARAGVTGSAPPPRVAGISP